MTYEDVWKRRLFKKRSPGGRSAVDPLIHTRKNAERLAVARESAHKPLLAVTCVKKVSLGPAGLHKLLFAIVGVPRTVGDIIVYRAKEKHAFNDAANKNGKSHALATYAGFWLKVTTFNAFHVWCRLKELNFKGGDMRILEIVKSICFRIRKDVFTEDLTASHVSFWSELFQSLSLGTGNSWLSGNFQSSCSPSSSTSSMSTHYCVSQCGFNIVGDFLWGWPPLVLSFFRTSSIKIVYTIQSSVVSFPFIGFRFSDLVPCYIHIGFVHEHMHVVMIFFRCCPSWYCSCGSFSREGGRAYANPDWWAGTAGSQWWRRPCAGCCGWKRARRSWQGQRT